MSMYVCGVNTSKQNVCGVNEIHIEITPNRSDCADLQRQVRNYYFFRSFPFTEKKTEMKNRHTLNVANSCVHALKQYYLRQIEHQI
jgi:hypothetical protein